MLGSKWLFGTNPLTGIALTRPDFFQGMFIFKLLPLVKTNGNERELLLIFMIII